MKADDIFCVVRSLGERTTDCCVALLERFAGAGNVSLVSRQPFGEALRETFRLGINNGKKWTLVIDADVLCSERLLARWLALADALPKNTFMFHASVADKFFGGYRRAGNRLYRTEHLPAALAKIPEDGTSLRPECDTCNAMLYAGWRNFQSYQILGLHDYEQYYRDILRKVVLFALKHKSWRERLRNMWLAKADDQDCMAALAAMDAADTSDERIIIGEKMIERLPPQVVAYWTGIEKPKLASDAFTPDSIEMLIKTELDRKGIVPTANIEPREYPLCAA